MTQPDPPVALLTFHGTLLCASGDALRHVALKDRPADVLLLPRDAAGDSVATAPTSGFACRPGLYAGTVSLCRDGRYASARPGGDVTVTATQCLRWESLLPLAPHLLALLQRIAASSWLVPGQGVVSSQAISFGPGFSIRFGALEIDLLRHPPQPDAGDPDSIVLTPEGLGPPVIARRIRPAARGNTQPKLHIVPRGNTANRALQYLTAEAIRAACPDAGIVNIHLPEWNRVAPAPPPPPATSARTGSDRYRIDIPGLADCLRRRVVDTLVIDGFTYNVDQYPARAAAKRLLGATVDGGAAEGFGPRDLVCSIRAGEVLRGVHPNYLPLPPGYYRMLAERSGLDLVFHGQLGDDAYTRSLRDAFPDARFVPGRSPGYDFDTLRRSVHLAPAISSFSWLAAWLSDAETIYLPVGGLFNPVQAPDLMFLPLGDPAYRYTLLPFARMTDIEADERQFFEQQAFIAAHARALDAEDAQVIAQRAAHLGKGRIPVGGFDPDYYVAHNRDAATAVARGRSALDHYMNTAARRFRKPLAFDAAFYTMAYPDAAMAIASGLFETPLHHFMAAGCHRGYLPVQPA